MIAQNIISAESASVFLKNGGRHDSDMQFIHKGAQYPGIVTETAYSQNKKPDGKDLHRVAGDYITESSGNIQTVIGISIRYQSTKKATLSTWRPKYSLDEQGEYLATEETVVSQV